MGIPGWVYGGGCRRGYTGVLPSARKEVPEPAKRARNPPAGRVEWWVLGPGASEPCDHPLQPRWASGARFAVTGLSSGKSRLRANKGEIKVNI